MASTSGKEEFLKQFEAIVAGVKRNKTKVKKKISSKYKYILLKKKKLTNIRKYKIKKKIELVYKINFKIKYRVIF